MKLVEASIRYPVSVIVVVILAVLFGALSLQRLPVQMIPTIDRPEITVQTPYPGAGPIEVEEEITNRQEELLNTVEGLREMLSTSREGESTIILKYDWGTNKDVARLDVSEKLAAVRNLPDDMEEPIIRAVNSDEQTPIAWIALVADEELNTVRPLAEDVIQAQLERLPGVGQVWFFGGEPREVLVEIDSHALAARGLSVADVRAALQQENRNIKAGSFNQEGRRFGVRTVGRYRKLEEVEQTIVRLDAVAPTRIGDVARVRFGYKERQFLVRQSGHPSIIFGVLRKSGSNTLEVMREVHALIDRINDRYADRGIELRVVYDASGYIRAAIDLVTTNLLIGAVLATTVLLFFLRSRSAVLVLGLAIPISLISVFIFVYVFGRTLNIISLAGLTFATGMVLDSSIVVVENIFRHREMGKGSTRAAYDGTVEVWGAILASTLTTLAVFLPILLVEEEAGQIFRDIAIAISIAIAMSLVVAITLIPMLSARLLRSDRKDSPGWGERLARAVTRVVALVLDWTFAHAARKAGVIAGILVLALGIGWSLLPNIDYLPEGNRNLIFVVLRTPSGFNLEQNERIVRMLEERILARKEVARMFTVVRLETPIMGVVLDETHNTKTQIREFIDRIEEFTETVPGVTGAFIRQSPLIRRGRLGSGNLDILVQGDDLGRIQRTAERLERNIENLEDVKFVNLSFELGKPEFVVDVDRARAAELGLSVFEIGALVEGTVNGLLVGTFDDSGREIDLRLRAPEGSIAGERDLRQTVLHTPSGSTVQLSDIAQVVARRGPTQVEHTDMDRSLKLSVGMDEKIPLSVAVDRLEAVLKPVRATLPLGYSAEPTGQATDLERTWSAFQGALLLALLITFLLLASLFESFTLPFVILFTIPFAASGGLLGLQILRLFDATVKLDTIAMLGFVILIGVVVNNAILIVHQTRNRMGEGSPPQRALIEAVSSRVRPILMTMATTVFGMSPLVFSSGSGAELYRGLGSILIGGLVVSTVFTLFLVPTVLSLVIREATEPATEPAALR